MKYKPEWRTFEKLADSELAPDSNTNIISTYNSDTYTSRDVSVMVTWLMYAATIGDLSYLKISGEKIQPSKNLNRPKFQKRDAR